MDKKRGENKIVSVLVTGAAGFIGSHVVDELINLGYRVVAVDDLSGGYEENVHKKAVFIRGSVTDYNFLEQIFEEYKPLFVYHLAAYAAEGLSHFIRRFNYLNNLIGTTNIINLCVNYNVKHLVFTSSIAVYGDITPPMVEDMATHPKDPYGVAKLAAEMDIKAASDMFGLAYTIFRPHNVYGERQNIADKYRNVIGIFMNQMMLGKPITVFGDGQQSRAFTYIKDISGTIAKSPLNAGAKNQVFNLGADRFITINELIRIMSKIMKMKPAIRYLEPRNEVVVAYADHTKVRKVFDTKVGCETPLEVGLFKMWVWVRKHGAKKTKVFENIEIKKKIPPVWLEK